MAAWVQAVSPAGSVSRKFIAARTKVECWLATPQTYAMHPVDTSQLATARGEFTEASLDDAFNRPKVYEGVVKEFCGRWRDKKAIVFCVNISATINTAQAFAAELGEGRVYAVHSKQSAYERADLI